MKSKLKRVLQHGWSILARTPPWRGLRAIRQFFGKQYHPPETSLDQLLPGPLRVPVRRLSHQIRESKVARYREMMQAYLNKYPGRPVILFAPTISWSIQLFQRPQQMALALARQGALGFYIQEPAQWVAPAFQEIAEGLVLASAPIESFWNLPKPFLYILTWNMGYVPDFDDARVIYDYVDDIAAFWGDHRRMRRNHQRLLHSAACVVTTAERLYQEVHPVRPDVVFAPNGVDYEAFTVSRSQASITPPVDLVRILAQKKPVIGYYGALARWFDYDLCKNLASRRPDLSFVFIGMDYDGSLKKSRILDLPNVSWLGQKPYEELPRYLHFFDVATIPFQLNEITHSTSPLKLFEYMAGGKPVVITAMQESMRYEGVLVAHSTEEFSEQIDQALRLKEDPEYLHRIDCVARKNTWEVRASRLLEALRNPKLKV